MSGELFGKHRGTVVDNVDPQHMGRIRAAVPEVSHRLASRWAMPCVPLAGPGMGMYFVPPLDANVWIEFERGDIERPIWSGCFWSGAGEAPSGEVQMLPGLGLVVQTESGSVVAISDVPGPGGGIVLKTASGATIRINDVEIVISNGRGASIVLAGPTVDINSGALSVL